MTGIEIVPNGVLREGFPVFLVTCTAEVPGQGNNINIIFDGVGGMEGGTMETSPGIFSITRTFLPVSASDSGIYECTLIVNGATIDTIEFGIDVDGKALVQIHGNF